MTCSVDTGTAEVVAVLVVELVDGSDPPPARNKTNEMAAMKIPNATTPAATRLRMSDGSEGSENGRRPPSTSRRSFASSGSSSAILWSLVFQFSVILVISQHRGELAAATQEVDPHGPRRRAHEPRDLRHREVGLVSEEDRGALAR